jgi:aspartyl-tRNA(Asn)/glutamyl-tRNA(Gln) amidotransferase subunit C
VSRITREEVAKLAELARLDLPESELDEYAKQLEIILESVAKVGEVSTKDVKPMSHATGLVNVFREDVTKESLSRDEILRSAPATEDDRFRVPRILDEE